MFRHPGAILRGITTPKVYKPNLLVYISFLVTSLIKTLYVEIHKMNKIFKFDIFINLQCFHNALVTSRLCSCQFILSIFRRYTKTVVTSLGSYDRASRAKYEDRKTNKMQQLDVYY